MSEDLEARVQALESVLNRLFNSATGMSFNMAWGTLTFGNDGFRIEQHSVRDCPEIGFGVSWEPDAEDNSIGKLSFRFNGNELALLQGKRARGFDPRYGADVGMFLMSVNRGGGSSDANMLDNWAFLPDKLVSKVPIEAPAFNGIETTPPPTDKYSNYSVGLVTGGREISVEIQTTAGQADPSMIVYDIRPLAWGGGAIPLYRVPLVKL